MTLNEQALVGNSKYEVLEIADGVHSIVEDRFVQCFLIEGNDGAVLLDRANRRLFVGDTVSDSQVFLFGDGRDLPAYIESLRKLELLTPLVDTIHSAHGSTTLSVDWIAKTRIAAEKLLAGELEAKDPPKNLPCKMYSYDGVNLLYNTGGIKS
ncbi:MAG: hypothetical protein LBQ95_01370 [Lachnospiraceae bacterium]|jgi:glyoxylase-like metal-dependent hydrolase (beta-lactamase superfamily II)|nr:hypothetical protein [Lachnospiraceae bacterium]